MDDKKNILLSQLAKEITVGFVGPMASEYINDGIPFLRSQNVIPFNLDLNDVKFISEDFHKKLKKSVLKPGDVVVVRTGKPGASAVIPDSLIESNCSDLVIIRCGEKLDPHFISYFINSINTTLIQSNLVGAVQQHFNVGAAKSIQIPNFNLERQHIISSVLMCLDNKIDLLHRQNKTLEQLAETLFRQWFVEEAEESWNEVKLSSLGKIICGKTPSKKVAEYFGGEIPFIKIPDMHGKTFVFDSEDSLTELGMNSQPNKTIPPKSICVSCIATVGLVVINAKISQTNQQINSIIPNKEHYRYFIYLKMLTMKDELLAMASGGTATDNLNTGEFSNIDILTPEEEKLFNFHHEIEPMFDKIFENQIQIRTLTQLRDTLLPKLMSGEVRVC